MVYEAGAGAFFIEQEKDMFCHQCGGENDDHFKFCQHCGAQISEDDKAPESRAQKPAMDSDLLGGESIDELFGEENDLPILDAADIEMQPVDESFDDVLNEAVKEAEPPEEVRVCRECGAIVEKDHNFCGKCGAHYSDTYDDPSTTHNSFVRRAVEKANFLSSMGENSTPQARFVLRHINDDGTPGEHIPIFEGKNEIGRLSSACLSGDRYVSPKHVCITCNDDFATVEDMGSLNGVFIRLTGNSKELNDGDTFRIGEELMTFSAGRSKRALFSGNEALTEYIGGEEPDCWGYVSVVLGAHSEGCVYRLYQPEVTFGRTRSDILFERDSFVSGLHAKLSNKDGRMLLTDLRSSNGTFLRFRNAVTVHSDPFYFLIGNQLLRLSLEYRS